VARKLFYSPRKQVNQKIISRNQSPHSRVWFNRCSYISIFVGAPSIPIEMVLKKLISVMLPKECSRASPKQAYWTMSQATSPTIGPCMQTWIFRNSLPEARVIPPLFNFVLLQQKIANKQTLFARQLHLNGSDGNSL
jgi:hypothetical protein